MVDNPSTTRIVLHLIDSLGRGGAQFQLLVYLQNHTPAWQHVVAYRRLTVTWSDGHRSLASPLWAEIERSGVRTFWLGHGTAIHQLTRLVRLARNISVGIIHTYLFGANYLGRLAGRLLRIPVVSTVTSTLEVEDRIASRTHAQLWKYRAFFEFEGWTARWGSSGIIAISQAVKESVNRTLGVSKRHITVVYPGVQSESLNESDRRTAGPTLISVGRLLPQKGQALLVRMLPLVLEQYPQCMLELVGIGADRDALERLTSHLGLSSHVRFLGWRADVCRLLNLADLFVHASWFEGFALVVAEAVAAGLPVVAVDLPVFREYTPRSSTILVKRNERAFADAVLYILHNLETFRAAARVERTGFRERFGIQHYVQGTEDVYAEAWGNPHVY